MTSWRLAIVDLPDSFEDEVFYQPNSPTVWIVSLLKRQRGWESNSNQNGRITEE